MRKISEAVRAAICLAALTLMALPGPVSAAGTGHEGMQGMQAAKTDDKAYSGKIGPWTGEALIVDMKAGMETSGMKMAGPMKNSHHLAVVLTDPKTKATIAEGKGNVVVTGPDKSRATSEFILMGGHFGADVNLPKPGKYTFDVAIESGGKKGSVTFPYIVK